VSKLSVARSVALASVGWFALLGATVYARNRISALEEEIHEAVTEARMSKEILGDQFRSCGYMTSKTTEELHECRARLAESRQQLADQIKGCHAELDLCRAALPGGT